MSEAEVGSTTGEEKIRELDERVTKLEGRVDALSSAAGKKDSIDSRKDRDEGGGQPSFGAVKNAKRASITPRSARASPVAEDVDELKDRVTARQLEMQAEIDHLKADGTCAAQERIRELETMLAQVRAVVHPNWQCLTRAGAATLHEWLSRLERDTGGRSAI